MTHPPLADDSTIGLCPFVVRGRGEHYSVIRREGRQAVSTGRAGVEAVGLLAAGRTIGQTRGLLGERYGVPASEVDLAPLLDTLFASGFVHTLDGRPVAVSPEPARHRLRAWLTLLVWSPLLELALKYLPLRLAVPLTYRWFGRAVDPGLEARVAAGLRRAPGLGLPAGAVARIAAGNAQALRKQFCDRLLLGTLPPRRARRWLGGEIQVSGLEHLARAVARAKGTILCSYHMGSYGLLPFALGARGVALTMYAGFGAEARADVATWLAERARRGDGYPVGITGGAMGPRALVRGLARGETVLLYCDRTPGEDERAAHETRGRIRVPFLGAHVWSARGLGWLHARTGATVLPAVLLWEGRRGHHLRIGPAIAGDPGANGSADAETVMLEAYGALERLVRQYPAQWLKWEDLAGMIAL
jgi:lauroyl/myristoyl acyltransferase